MHGLLDEFSMLCHYYDPGFGERRLLSDDFLFVSEFMLVGNKVQFNLNCDPFVASISAKLSLTIQLTYQ